MAEGSTSVSVGGKRRAQRRAVSRSGFQGLKGTFQRAIARGRTREQASALVQQRGRQGGLLNADNRAVLSSTRAGAQTTPTLATRAKRAGVRNVPTGRMTAAQRKSVQTRTKAQVKRKVRKNKSGAAR